MLDALASSGSQAARGAPPEDQTASASSARSVACIVIGQEIVAIVLDRCSGR